MTTVIFLVFIDAAIAAILATVQYAANIHNVAVLGKRHAFKKVFVGEAVFVVLGMIIGVLAIVGVFVDTSSNSSTPSVNSEVTAAEEKMNFLRSEYEVCSSSLESRRGSVNTYSDYEVDSFNSDLQNCENTRTELNQAVSEYNRLAGFE
jgi:hypothetical protein